MPGDPSERKQERARKPIADDFRAAEEVLARLMPSLDQDAHEYHDKRQALAQRRAKVGGDRFDLRHGLRPPRNAFERVNVDFLQGRITQDQFREAWKADAGRLIDIEMLNAFCNAYEDRLQSYSRMLQTVIAIATDQRKPDAWRRREAEVDRHVEEMKAKLPLWKEQVGTVFTFLTELQADRSGEPVQCGDHSAANAHALANLVIDHAAGGWRGCKKIAAQSRTDPRYLYATSASHSFYTAHLPGLPRPNDLMALMVLEHARARKAIQEQPGTAKTDPSASASISIQAEAVNVTTPSVNVAEVKQDGDGKPARGTRMKRDVAEPLIRERRLQAWDDDAAEYLPLSAARKLIDDRLSLQTLGRLCKPDGEIRYMRKGQRCKVHVADFRRYMQSQQGNPEWAEAYMNWLHATKVGKNRMFWKCSNSACGHEYPDDVNATVQCPKCKNESKLLTKAPPKPRR